MRAAQSQASNLQNQAGATAAGYGTGASDIASTLTPFLTREINAPPGFSQQDQTAMLSADQGGAGGVASGLVTRGDERAAANGNESGFGTTLDDIARQREKAAAQGSESIAARNAGEKLEQQQAGARGLQGLYGTDVGAQLGSMGIQNNAINTEVNAGSHGWFQNMTNLIASIRGGGRGTPSLPNMNSGPSPSGGSGMGDDEDEFASLAASA